MLDLADPVALTAALVDIPSPSGQEGPLADEVEQALTTLSGFATYRDGDAVVARTELGRSRRVVLAGHLDTVPIADNLPSRREGPLLFGCGSSDMKAGAAVMLHLAALGAQLGHPRYDLTVIAYDNEEVEAAKNGLGRLARNRPEWMIGDLAIVLEPTNGALEAGCQGSIRATVTTRGLRAHAARWWLGENAIQAAVEPLRRLHYYAARTVELDGCVFREGLNAVRIHGGVAGNVIPDECVIEVSYRFAPDRDVAQAAQHVREVFAGYDVVITDSSPPAPPALAAPALRELIQALDQPVSAKYGWTDVARFAAAGVPAINCGPGDPGLAHKPEEHVDTQVISRTAAMLAAFLYGTIDSSAGAQRLFPTPPPE